VAQASCYRPGFVQFNGHTYRVLNKGRSWADAKAAAESQTCAGVQGHLVDINSADEQDFLHNTLHAVGWTGGHRGDESHWEWSDETNFHTTDEHGAHGSAEGGAYTNWHNDEPNNYGGNEECLEIYDDGTWNDVTCDSSKPAIAEWDGVWDIPSGNLEFRVAAERVSENSLQPRFERLRRKLRPSHRRHV